MPASPFFKEPTQLAPRRAVRQRTRPDLAVVCAGVGLPAFRKRGRDSGARGADASARCHGAALV